MMTVDLVALSLVEYRSGFIYLQPQPYSEQGTGVSYEAHAPFGLMGRPRGPTSDGAPNAFVFRHGPEGVTIATSDPRYQDALPNCGEGGAGLYATASVGGSVQVSSLALYGTGGDQTEGTFRADVKTAVGTTTITVDPTTGDVTITHAGGAVVVVKAASVELGAATGGLPLALATPIAAWAALVVSALGTLGQTVPTLAGVACTKVNGT